MYRLLIALALIATVSRAQLPTGTVTRAATEAYVTNRVALGVAQAIAQAGTNTQAALSSKVSLTDATYTATVARAASALQSSATNGLIIAANATNIAQSVVDTWTNRITTAWQNPPDSTNWTWTSEGNEITLTGYFGGETNIIIPEFIDGLPVSTIALQTFQLNTTVKSITGVSILHASEYAFSGCTALETVELPYIETLKEYAFFGCTALKNVSIKNIKVLGYETFSGCVSIASLNLYSVQEIQENTFVYCTGLHSVYFDYNAPIEGLNIYLDLPVNQVTNYVTSSTATGWGATFGGMPVIRLPVKAQEVNAGTVISITSNTEGTNSAGFFSGNGGGLTDIPASAIIGLSSGNITNQTWGAAGTNATYQMSWDTSNGTFRVVEILQ